MLQYSGRFKDNSVIGVILAANRFRSSKAMLVRVQLDAFLIRSPSLIVAGRLSNQKVE